MAAAALAAACGDSTGPSDALKVGSYQITVNGSAYGRGTAEINLILTSATDAAAHGTYTVSFVQGHPASSGSIGDGEWQADAYRFLVDPFIVRLQLVDGKAVCDEGEAVYNPGPEAEFWACTVHGQPG